MSHFFRVGDESRQEGEYPRTDAVSARFRLVRQGNMLFYLISDADSAGFREVFRTHFGTQDLEFVRLAANPGGSRRTVEVIWKDLTIKAECLPGLAKPDHDPIRTDATR